MTKNTGSESEALTSKDICSCMRFLSGKERDENLSDKLNVTADGPVLYGVEADFRYNLARVIDAKFKPSRIYFDYEYPSTCINTTDDGVVKRKLFDLVVCFGEKKTVIELKYKKASLVATKSNDQSKYGDIVINADVAHNLGRYNFIKDIIRLEGICRSDCKPDDVDTALVDADNAYDIYPKDIIGEHNDAPDYDAYVGIPMKKSYKVLTDKATISDSSTMAKFAVFLTNDNAYWTKPKAKKPSRTGEQDGDDFKRNNDHMFQIYQGRKFDPSKACYWIGGTFESDEDYPALKPKGDYEIVWRRYADIGSKRYRHSEFNYTIVHVT